MRVWSLVVALIVTAVSLPVWAEPDPPAGSPEKALQSGGDPKGLQVEPVDFKEGKDGKVPAKGKPKKTSKPDKANPPDKSNPEGLQVEPVDIKPVEGGK